MRKKDMMTRQYILDVMSDGKPRTAPILCEEIKERFGAELKRMNVTKFLVRLTEANILEKVYLGVYRKCLGEKD